MASKPNNSNDIADSERSLREECIATVSYSALSEVQFTQLVNQGSHNEAFVISGRFLSQSLCPQLAQTNLRAVKMNCTLKSGQAYEEHQLISAAPCESGLNQEKSVAQVVFAMPMGELTLGDLPKEGASLGTLSQLSEAGTLKQIWKVDSETETPSLVNVEIPNVEANGLSGTSAQAQSVDCSQRNLGLIGTGLAAAITGGFATVPKQVLGNLGVPALGTTRAKIGLGAAALLSIVGFMGITILGC